MPFPVIFHGAGFFEAGFLLRSVKLGFGNKVLTAEIAEKPAESAEQVPFLPRIRFLVLGVSVSLW